MLMTKDPIGPIQLPEILSVHEIDSRPQAAVVFKPVSADSLRKTGIFADTAGDFPRFPHQDRRTGSLETKSNTRKAGFPARFRVSGEA
jgi:hypothetical protein